MRSRLMTLLLVLALGMFATAGTVTAVGHISKSKNQAKAKAHKKHHAKKKAKKRNHGASQQHVAAAVPEDKSSAQSQYGTRPGKGCGDKNHVHTGPPGNPSNTSCPPQSQKSQPATTTTKPKPKAQAKRKQARHKKARKRNRRGH